MESEKPIWSWVNKEVWLIGIVIGAIFAIFVPIWQLKTEVALTNQKLDTLLAWVDKHDTLTSKQMQEINTAFAYVYERLGSKYIKQQ